MTTPVRDGLQPSQEPGSIPGAMPAPTAPPTTTSTTEDAVGEIPPAPTQARKRAKATKEQKAAAKENKDALWKDIHAEQAKARAVINALAEKHNKQVTHILENPILPVHA